MMLYVANGRGAGLGLLRTGGVLGVVAIPAYAFGYRAAAGLIGTESPRAARTVNICGLLVGVLGGAIHGLTAVFVGRQIASGSVGQDPIAAVAASGPLLPVLWVLAAGAVLVASCVFAYRIVRGAASTPRTLALASPAVLTIAFAAIGVVSGPLAPFLAPAAPNLAHIAFFTTIARTNAEARAPPI
jgi:hypothetical protein